MNPSAFLDSAEAHLSAAFTLLRRLVAINSFTARPEGVAEVARLTAEAFAPLGFAAHEVPCAIPSSGPHLLLSRPGEGDPVVLVTHSDTVFPPEEEDENAFFWDERPEEGRVYGPGTVDNKGGTALIWLVLQILRERAPEVYSKSAWLIASNAAEEVTGDDFGRVVSGFCQGRARAVLVFEGGPIDERGWHLVTSRKGRSTWRLDVAGKAAHAGSQHREGINAIDALASVLPGIAAWTDRAEDRTVNVGRVEGGTVVNRVPHQALAEWECRAADPASLARADAAFAALAGLAGNGARLSATRTGHTPAWPGGEGTRRLFSLWSEAASGLGLRAVSVPRGGLSDANHLGHLGPTLDGLGPCGGNAHCSQRSADGSVLPEFVEMQSFARKAAMNALALAGLP